jgi:putative membrane protein
MKLNKSNWTVIFLSTLFVVTLWSAYKPKDYATWVLEALPMFLIVSLLYFTRKKFPLTALTYTGVWCLMVGLLIGAHFTYSEVPLFDWIQETFNTKRNHFDRFGHFFQGFVPALAAREFFLRKKITKNRFWTFFTVCAFCFTFAAFYELIEWWVAVLFGGGSSAFLGLQGDEWDAQKDMGLALLGSALAQILLGKAQDKQIAKVEASKTASKKH